MCLASAVMNRQRGRGWSGRTVHFLLRILDLVRRYGLTAIIALATISLGILAFQRGQFWLGVCFIGIAVLRALVALSRRRTPKDQAGIRLNLGNPHDDDRDQDVNGKT